MTSVVTGLLRILFALMTIPLALESVRQGNYPGDGNHQYVAFYWTESLVSLRFNAVSRSCRLRST